MLSCSDDKPTEPDGSSNETVIKTIDPEGGEIMIDELVFKIPSERHFILNVIIDINLDIISKYIYFKSD